jgi:endonuclease YncB( thermonuclease family)
MQIGRLAILAAIACFYILSASAEELVGRVVRIADGHTLAILEASNHQRRIRLADIDAPEKAQPFGTRSRRSLAELCAGKVATVDDHGQDRYGRTIGQVMCAGIDANAEQVRRGMAWVYVQYASPISALY